MIETIMGEGGIKLFGFLPELKDTAENILLILDEVNAE